MVCLLPPSSKAVPGRAALVAWLGKLDLRNWGERDSPDVPRGNVGLDCIAIGERLDPRELLLWISPSLGGLLFDLIKDEAGIM